MQTAIEKLQEAMKLSETVLNEPINKMGGVADSLRMTIVLHKMHNTMEEVLKMLSE